MAFARFSWWVLGAGGKDNDPTAPANSPPSSSLELGLGLGFRERDSLKFPSSSRRVKRKWQSREERKVDREYDIVIVPSDGGCMSGSESDDSDWSIGWLEPHSAEFNTDTESENSFAVLVPCYGRGRGTVQVEESPKHHHLLGGVDFTSSYSHSESKKYIEQWLSSLQNF
ncbi:hypothetical protein J5N97_006588 [Dioscorea zingiberensis]|uniref:Uncharacterized protein n=1 Tax=Dioscorea zingiberensis TaxID=325984 RepID=A0A9D5HU60_9LILI|nr:hypothetical protein J5N97_006588 [Dioscorea zingiberensis]